MYLLKCWVVQDATWFFVLFEDLDDICFKKFPEICHFMFVLFPVLLHKEVITITWSLIIIVNLQL